jgi:hypothetical protein
MNRSLPELAGLLCRCQTGIAALLRQTSSREERAARLADLLRELMPTADLTACLLSRDGSSSLVVRSAKGSVRPEQMESLRSCVASLDSLSTDVQSLPAEGPLAGLRSVAAALHEDDRRRGVLLIGLAGDAPVEDLACAEALLTVCASTMALRWELETVRGEQAELARFALVGQAFIGLAHDLNNALNSMMLQASVVQLRSDERTRNDLAPIRQHGAQAAGLLRSLQHVAQERREQSYAVDLNAVVASVLEEEPELRSRVAVQFAAEAATIPSTRSAVKQLVCLVLEGICAGTKSAVQVRIEKLADGAGLYLQVAEAPAGMAEEGSPPLADAVLWQNLDEVGRQAGQSLLRQLGGTLEVERRAEGGVVLRAIWGPS